MTNFSAALYSMVDDRNIEKKDERTQDMVERFGLTYEQAMQLDNIICATSRNINRMIGRRIDESPPELRMGLVRSLLGTCANNMMTVQFIIGLICEGVPLEAMGMNDPDTCTCPACAVHRALRTECMTVMGEQA